MSNENEDLKNETVVVDDEDQPFLHEKESPDSQKKAKQKGMIKNILYGILAIGILLIVTVVTTVLIIVYTRENQNMAVFSFDDMFDGKFKPQTVTPQFISQTSSFAFFKYLSFTNDTADLVMYSHTNQEISVLIAWNELKTNNITSSTEFSISGRGTYIFFKTNTRKRFRHSNYGKYIAYNTATKSWIDISGHDFHINLKPCPNNTNILSYVDVNNNIFIYNMATKEKTQVTSTGVKDIVFNGVADWLYEEDVLGDYDMSFWSCDCSKLAYIRLNDSLVHDYVIQKYEKKKCYPEYHNIKYPVAGGVNPEVDVFYYNVIEKKNLKIDLGAERDIYVYDVKWKSASEMAVIRYSRSQQKKDVMMTSNMNDVSSTIVNADKIKEFKTNCWFQYRRQLQFFSDKNGDNFVDIIVDNSNDRFALGIYNFADLTKPHLVISNANYDITRIYSIIPNKAIYYSAINAAFGYVCVYNYTTGKTSIISKEDGYYDAWIGHDKTYMILNYKGPNIPHQDVISFDGRKNVEIISNKHVNNARLNIMWPKTEVNTFTLREYDMDYMITYPPSFTTANIYPVLIHLYGGPGSKLVQKTYSAMNVPFHTYMASNGFIVATLDGRGTAGKGYTFMKEVYKQLGVKETEDQVSFKKFLGNLLYVDAEKMSIWGWSYGGFESLLTMMAANEKKSGVNAFSVGISIAPVTNQKYYDSAYAERYMGMPNENMNYVNTSVMERMKDNSFDGTHLLLCHGLYDDNVHPLNSMYVITELQERGIQFDLMMFPNKSHSLEGEKTQKFLYKKLSDTLINKGKL